MAVPQKSKCGLDIREMRPYVVVDCQTFIFSVEGIIKISDGKVFQVAYMNRISDLVSFPLSSYCAHTPNSKF